MAGSQPSILFCFCYPDLTLFDGCVLFVCALNRITVHLISLGSVYLKCFHWRKKKKDVQLNDLWADPWPEPVTGQDPWVTVKYTPSFPSRLSDHSETWDWGVNQKGKKERKKEKISSTRRPILVEVVMVVTMCCCCYCFFNIFCSCSMLVVWKSTNTLVCKCLKVPEEFKKINNN